MTSVFSSALTPRHRPKVSIMLITYNHEKYIAQALESILMQETQYDIEINVIEDCSTDNTQQVVMRYVQLFPDIVKPYFNKKNIGYKVTQKNFIRGFKTLKGDYFAILEGDDYWTSPHKLQKQVEFLEAHPDYVACAHNVIKMYEDGSKEPHRFLYWPGKPADNTIEDIILMSSYFHTTTLTFRNVLHGNPPPQFISRWSCELFVTMVHAQFGKIRYFDEDMSIYRAHGGGRFSNMKALEGWYFNIGSLRRYNQWLRYRYVKTFARSIIRYCDVVLLDKGKEAALPSKYQYIKYLGIKTMYRVIYCLACVPDKIHLLPMAPIDKDMRLKDKCLAYCRYSFQVASSALKAGPTLLQQSLEAITAVIYVIIAELLPESAKDAVRKFEKTHEGIRYLRRLKREEKLFSGRSIKIVQMATLKNLGLRHRASRSVP